MQNLRNTFKRHSKAQVKRLKQVHRHPFWWPIASFVALLVIATAVVAFFSGGKPQFTPDNSYIVILTHDNTTQSVPTNERTIADLLPKLHITLSRGDRIEPSLSTPIVQDNLRVNIYRAVPITISDGITTTTTLSAAATPRSIVAESGLTIYAEDKVTTAPVTNLVSQASLGQQVTIERSVPVIMNVYGTPLQLRTHTKTVAELLKAKNIKLGTEDSVVPAMTTDISPGIQVFVVRKGTQIVTQTQAIPAPIQTVTDTTLSFGTSAVRQQGSTGTQVLTYQVNLQNGVEVSRSLLQSVTTVQPVTQIVAKGLAVSIPADKQGVMADAGIAASDYAYVDYIVSHESGWCPTKLQGQVGVCPGYAPDNVPSGLGYGLGQATPGTKMSSFGADWKTNPVTQLRWATSYAVGRYGSWSAAYDHWSSNRNW